MTAAVASLFPVRKASDFSLDSTSKASCPRYVKAARRPQIERLIAAGAEPLAACLMPFAAARAICGIRVGNVRRYKASIRARASVSIAVGPE
ncbi:MAG: hypothetical protein ACREQN_13730 [Candidatus Binataceae bacterium]